MGIADMLQMRYTVEKLMKNQIKMEEEFQTMLDLLEKNRSEDLSRLVTPEYLQDKIRTLETDFKIKFEERFDFFD